MSAVLALEKFRYGLVNFLANPEAIYKDIEIDNYQFTLTKQQSDAWLCNLIGMPVTPYVVLTIRSARNWDIEKEVFQIFYEVCKLRYKICVVFQTWHTEREGWTNIVTDGFCYLYRLSDEVQERQK